MQSCRGCSCQGNNRPLTASVCSPQSAVIESGRSRPYRYRSSSPKHPVANSDQPGHRWIPYQRAISNKHPGDYAGASPGRHGLAVSTRTVAPLGSGPPRIRQRTCCSDMWARPTVPPNARTYCSAPEHHRRRRLGLHYWPPFRRNVRLGRPRWTSYEQAAAGRSGTRRLPGWP